MNYSDILKKQWGLVNLAGDPLTILNFLKRFKDHPCLTCCELGVAEGQTANRIIDALKFLEVKSIYYYGVDNGSLVGQTQSTEHQEMTFVLGDHKILANYGPFDLGFIDACHCAECIYHDAIYMSREIPVGGYMMFHDTSLMCQYPASGLERLGTWQHYNVPDENIRPINVVEGIVMSRASWKGSWRLVVQEGDLLLWGGIRVYQRVE